MGEWDGLRCGGCQGPSWRGARQAGQPVPAGRPLAGDGAPRHVPHRHFENKIANPVRRPGRVPAVRGRFRGASGQRSAGALLEWSGEPPSPSPRCCRSDCDLSFERGADSQILRATGGIAAEPSAFNGHHGHYLRRLQVLLPTCSSASQSASQPASQPVRKSASQPASQPVSSQPVS